MRTVRILLALGCAAGAALAAPGAEAAITITPGADTVSTPRLELDFGDSAANVERLDSVRWRDSNGVLGGNLATNDGSGGCDAPAPPLHWGEAGSAFGAPQPVGSGSRGTWTLRATRTVEVNSSRPTSCTADTTVTPVRTRYTFFNVGDGAGHVRVERTFSFSASTPSYATASMRAYVPRLALAPFSQVVHPNAAGNALVTEASTNPATAAASWNGTWIAINDPATNAGLLIRRETSLPARLLLENDGTANSSAVDLLKPGAGWKAPVTETEWLCFYDATTWPPGSRAPNVLPSQCSVVTVPINTTAPVISGTPKVASAVTASNGAWDGSPSFSIQWLSCAGGACSAIAGATGASYTPVPADEGRELRVDVTATAPSGEIDTASSALSAPVQGGPPQNTGVPAVFGEAREDEVLTGNNGTWSGSPTSFQYQWRRCSTAAGTGCVDVARATASTYKLVRLDVGATMRLRVTAVNAVGSSLPADSAPTGEVQREVVRAFLAASSPNPTCTGIGTTFDASASKTPNAPIARYLLTYKAIPYPAEFALLFGAAFGSGDLLGDTKRYLARLPAATLYDGPDPRTVARFTWNRQVDKFDVALAKFLRDKLQPGEFVRDTIYVTLTVTDKAGAKATATEPVEVRFAQHYAHETRKNCPKLNQRANRRRLATIAQTSVTQTTFTALIPCAAPIDCAGSLSVFRVTSKRVARAAAAKPVLIARNKLFTVRAGKRANVRAKLTAAGRRLAARGKPFRARVRLTSIDPVTARRTTSSQTVTLR